MAVTIDVNPSPRHHRYLRFVWVIRYAGQVWAVGHQRTAPEAWQRAEEVLKDGRPEWWRDLQKQQAGL